MTEERDLRLFMGGWIGALIIGHTPWLGGFGIIVAVVIAWASVKLTWWWADRPTKGGEE